MFNSEAVLRRSREGVDKRRFPSFNWKNYEVSRQALTSLVSKSDGDESKHAVRLNLHLVTLRSITSLTFKNIDSL